MSLLEDIFLEDEAGEAQELERVIEGDEFDERLRSRSGSPNDSDDNEPKDDEAEEDKRRVDPSATKTKRVIKNPRFILNPARLTGPRGIQILPDHFKDFKFKGKGHEKEDLDMLLKKLEHWAYRLYPKFEFEDCLKKIESLGKKRPVMVHLQKIRTDQYISEETVVQKDSSDEETQPPQEQDEFDKLLQQQIDLARATPAPHSVKKVMHTPKNDRSPFTMPKATSSPSISDDQKERMIRNRKLAEERRLARLKQNPMNTTGKQDSVIIEVDEEVETNVTAEKQHKSFVIASSDDEFDVTSVNQSVTADVHKGTNTREVSDDKVVVEEIEENLDNIEIEANVDKNYAQEGSQDVEIVDHADKDTGKNSRGEEPTDEAVKIIEINDQSDRIGERNNHENNVVGDIIEIGDESNQGAINIENKVIEGIIEINDPYITDNVKETNATEVIKDNTSTVDVNNSNNVLTPEVIVNDNNSTEHKRKSSGNDSGHKECMEHTAKLDDAKDSNSKEVGTLENGNADEVFEDIMDVDFSEDF